MPNRLRYVAALLLWLFSAGVLHAQSDAKRHDPAVWGVYAHLVGNEWTASFKRRIEVLYTGANGSELMVFSSSGIGGATASVIEPAGVGKLRWREGEQVLDGTIEHDGSVVWSYGANSFVAPFRHSLQDGVLTVAKVGLKDGRYVDADVQGRYRGQPASKTSATVAMQSAASAPASAPASPSPATAQAAVARTPDPDASVATRWGVLASLPGRVWRSNAKTQQGTTFFIDAHWDTPGQVLRVDDHNGRVALYTLLPDGRVRMQFFRGGVPDSQWDGYGTVSPDRSVEFTVPAKGNHVHYRLDDQGRLEQRFYSTSDRKVTLAARYEKGEPTAALTDTGRRLNPIRWGRLSALPGLGRVTGPGSSTGFVASSDGKAIYWLSISQGRPYLSGVVRWSERNRAPALGHSTDAATPGFQSFYLPEPDGDDGIYWNQVSPSNSAWDEAWVLDGQRLLTAAISGYSGKVTNADYEFGRLAMQAQPGFDAAFRLAEAHNAVFDTGLARAQKKVADYAAAQDRAERNSQRADAWSRAMRQVQGALNETDAVLQDYVAERQAVTDANIAAIRRRVIEQRRQQAQRPQDANAIRSTKDRASAGGNASRANASTSGAVAVQQAAPTARAPAARPNDTGQREVYIVCEVISMSGTESAAHGKGGALLISAVSRVRLQNNRAPNLQSDFARRVQSQFNRTGPAICETEETSAKANARIDSWKRAYPQYRHVMTGIDPTL